MIEARMLLGSVWLNKKKTIIIAIVKIVKNHPDLRRGDEIIVLVLDLLTGETRELVFHTKEDAFPAMPIARL